MTIRLTWRRILLGLAGLFVGGMLFAWSGLFNVAATGGHWAVTDWFLHWVMRNSVRTHALLVEAPPALDPALVARGAGHYASGCAPCHGAPGEPQNPIVQQSTPPPPEFPRDLGEWTPRQLFHITQGGVRYTGMPGWIAPERSDEIWAVVAFLEALPEMTPEAYRRLAYGEEAERRAFGESGMQVLGEQPLEALADCARCHSRDGLGRDGDAFPVIAGQSEAYLLQALRAFADGSRPSGMMQPPAARAGDAALQALARHFAAQRPPPVPAGPVNTALLQEGERIAREGIAAAQVPACLACHGNAARQRNPGFPRLEGQHARYLEGQLALWRQGERGGGPHGDVMGAIAARMSADQARAAAAWFAAQPQAAP